MTPSTDMDTTGSTTANGDPAAWEPKSPPGATEAPTATPQRPGRIGARHIRAGRIGGSASLVLAGTFVVGIVMFATSLAEYTAAGTSPEQSVAFLVDHRTLLFAWYAVTLILFGIALVPLVLSLHQRLTRHTPGLAAVATSFGLMWSGLILATGMISNVGLNAVSDLAGSDPAQAESLWSALDAVTNGLGGGNELVGGMWVLLVSIAALNSAMFPRALNCLGIVSAAAGLVTVVPGLEDVGMVFGLGLIVWFAWLGVVLIQDARNRRP